MPEQIAEATVEGKVKKEDQVEDGVTKLTI